MTAVLLGKNIDDIAEKLIKYGADKVLYVEDDLLSTYTTDAYSKVIYELVEERKPEIFLIGATNIGRDLGPRLSARIHTGLTADCTRLNVDLENRRLMMTRPAFGEILWRQLCVLITDLKCQPLDLELWKSKIQ